MEKRDLYDINRNLTGNTIYKGEKTPENCYIIVVLAFIENSKGEFLIQKRSKQKDGKFGSTGGHAKSGESSIQRMLTEIKEELGLTLSPAELNLLYSGRSDSSHVFFDIDYTRQDFDISNLTLQKDEVESVSWMTVDEIDDLIKNNLFLANHVDEFYRTMKILNKL